MDRGNKSFSCNMASMVCATGLALPTPRAEEVSVATWPEWCVQPLNMGEHNLVDVFQLQHGRNGVCNPLLKYLI